jgi:hypothetical protein
MQTTAAAVVAPGDGRHDAGLLSPELAAGIPRGVPSNKAHAIKPVESRLGSYPNVTVGSLGDGAGRSSPTVPVLHSPNAVAVLRDVACGVQRSALLTGTEDENCRKHRDARDARTLDVHDVYRSRDLLSHTVRDSPGETIAAVWLLTRPVTIGQSKNSLTLVVARE